MGLKIEHNGKVVAVHQLTGRWAVYRSVSGEEIFAMPVHARVFVLEHDEDDEFPYLESYEVSSEADGCLEDPSTCKNWIESIDAASEAEAIAIAVKNESERKEKK